MRFYKIDVPQPPTHRLNIAELFDEQTGKVRHELLRQHLISEGRLEESAVIYIIKQGAEILRKEPNLLKIEEPVTSKLFHLIIFFNIILLYNLCENVLQFAEIYTASFTI